MRLRDLDPVVFFLISILLPAEVHFGVFCLFSPPLKRHGATLVMTPSSANPSVECCS